MLSVLDDQVLLLLADIRSFFRSSRGAGLDLTSLFEAREDFGDAAVGDSKIAGNDAGTNSHLRHLDDFFAGFEGQGATIDEGTAELVEFCAALHFGWLLSWLFC